MSFYFNDKEREREAFTHSLPPSLLMISRDPNKLAHVHQVHQSIKLHPEEHYEQDDDKEVVRPELAAEDEREWKVTKARDESVAKQRMRRPFAKKQTYYRFRAGGPDEVWQMDIMDMGEAASRRAGNHRKRYLLVAIDVYSRFAFVHPMSTKDEFGHSTVQQLFHEAVSGHPPYVLVTDSDSVFINHHTWTSIADLRSERVRGGDYSLDFTWQGRPAHMEHLTPEIGDKTRVSLIERFIQRLRSLITYRQQRDRSHSYLQYILPSDKDDPTKSVVAEYNYQHIHSATGRKPYHVYHGITLPIKARSRDWVDPSRGPKAKALQESLPRLGDYVRIRLDTNEEQRFKKRSATPIWSFQVYRIVAIINKRFQLMNKHTHKLVRRLYKATEIQKIDRIPSDQPTLAEIKRYHGEEIKMQREHKIEKELHEAGVAQENVLTQPRSARSRRLPARFRDEAAEEEEEEEKKEAPPRRRRGRKTTTTSPEEETKRAEAIRRSKKKHKIELDLHLSLEENIKRLRRFYS